MNEEFTRVRRLWSKCNGVLWRHHHRVFKEGFLQRRFFAAGKLGFIRWSFVDCTNEGLETVPSSDQTGNWYITDFYRHRPRWNAFIHFDRKKKEISISVGSIKTHGKLQGVFAACQMRCWFLMGDLQEKRSAFFTPPTLVYMGSLSPCLMFLNQTITSWRTKASQVFWVCRQTLQDFLLLTRRQNSDANVFCRQKNSIVMCFGFFNNSWRNFVFSKGFHLSVKCSVESSCAHQNLFFQVCWSDVFAISCNLPMPLLHALFCAIVLIPWCRAQDSKGKSAFRQMRKKLIWSHGVKRTPFNSFCFKNTGFWGTNFQRLASVRGVYDMTTDKSPWHEMHLSSRVERFIRGSGKKWIMKDCKGPLLA